MLEPIIQDYIRAATQLDRDAFCKSLNASVLISVIPQFEQSFQDASTRMLSEEDQVDPSRLLSRLDHKSKVLEMRPLRPQQTWQVTIGRSEDNDLVLQDDTVSSHHAIFQLDPKTGSPTIQDRESSNGTLINNLKPLPYRFIPLADGDIVSFGDTFYVFFTPGGLYDLLSKMTIA